MYLLEHDAKEVFAYSRIPVPAGCLVESVQKLRDAVLPPGPWVVKGQITAGGRGKAGLIMKAGTVEELHAEVGAIIGQSVRGRSVAAVRVEQQISGAEETYLSLLLDAAAGGVRIIVSAQGGVDVEALPHDAIHTAIAAPEVEAIALCAQRLTATMPRHFAAALRDAAE